MSYIQSTLIKDEEIILAPQVHPIVYWNPLISIGVLILFLGIIGSMDSSGETWSTIGSVILLLFLVGLFWHFFNKWYYKNVEMAVTNKRVVAKTGIISVHSEELQWNRIESIEIRQGILGRIFGYGNVHFTGTGTSSVLFRYVQDPWAVKAKSAEILSR